MDISPVAITSGPLPMRGVVVSPSMRAELEGFLKAYILADAQALSPAIADILDLGDVLYLLSNDERVRPEFHGKVLAMVLQEFLGEEGQRQVAIMRAEQKAK